MPHLRAKGHRTFVDSRQEPVGKSRIYQRDLALAILENEAAGRGAGVLGDGGEPAAGEDTLAPSMGERVRQALDDSPVQMHFISIVTRNNTRFHCLFIYFCCCAYFPSSGREAEPSAYTARILPQPISLQFPFKPHIRSHLLVQPRADLTSHQ